MPGSGVPVPEVSVSGAPVPEVSVSGAPSAASAAAATTAPVPPTGEPCLPAEPAAVHRAGPWHWRASAACRDLSPAVVFARRIKDAAPALLACAVCPVRRECVRAVAPAESLFDGVCGGRLWRNGRPAAVPSSSGSLRD
ncbi:WhiB family transcriptional regulator [Streptomyces sp. NPDC058622]|uniref:WhiB family transcriptional regulator n=1 Tax=Streptomyces sp. NPDC058622 TaxID=3346562 RepID=UPI003658B3B1